MRESVQVVEDGVTADPSSTSSRPSWLMGLVGFVVGLGLGVMVVQPDPEPETGDAVVTTPSVAEPTTSTTLEVAPEALGVSGAIPGFPDALVVVARTSGSFLNHVLWPYAGDVIVRSMTGGGDVMLDVSSQFIAMSEDVPDLDGGVLSLGRFHSMRPVASGALSYAWHDSTLGSLSYTASASGSTVLYTVRADLQSIEVAMIPAPGATVVGWGDWGWAIQRDADEMVLLTPEGEFKDSESGLALDTHASGWVLARSGTGAKLVSAGGGVRLLSGDLGVGTLSEAQFSPDGAKVAVTGTSGIAVVDLGSDEAVVLADFPTASLAWSSDSRFVLAPTASGVVVFDLEDPTRPYLVLREHSVLAVGTSPLSSS
ncbi:MAG: hypothetical protein PVJ28_03080 [Acidimicrobiia bacterium]|jgi:hypothetical protein